MRTYSSLTSRSPHRQEHCPYLDLIIQIQLLRYRSKMDVRKLIDDTDFDNINELSKKWKKESHHTSKADSDFDASTSRVKSDIKPDETSAKLKENIHQQATGATTKQTNADFKRKREVMPQVIDQDTEHFRNRLEHLLNGFKTDAVSEFMSMKKAMLEYQKETIKGDTQKYLTMYQQKHKQLLQAKDKLISLTSDVEKKSVQIELMSSHIAKLNQRLKTNQYLSRPFALLYENKVQQKMMKIKMKEASRYDIRNTQIKAFNGWRNMYREANKEKQDQINNQKVEIEVKDIVAKFQKEIESLKDKLYETTRKNQEYQQSKHLIQENLKKAFLRGISSMNMEAIGIFGTAPQISESRHQSFENNRSERISIDTSLMRTQKEEKLESNFTNSPKPNSSVIMNKSKIQSKDHKWKEAPIMGFAEKEEVEEPRPHLVKPTTEAKVIRVIDGKSAVDNTIQKDKYKKAPTVEAMGGNRIENGKRRP